MIYGQDDMEFKLQVGDVLMRDEEKIEKYLLDAETQFHKTMRAYFKTRSYISKLRNMELNEEQEDKLNKIEERFNWNIKNRMRSE